MKYYWQGFVFPWSPLCPHWCHCLGSSRLSYPTGFTKPKRDWLLCSRFLCRSRPADRSCRFQEWWSYVYITINHYSTGILSKMVVSGTIAHNHFLSANSWYHIWLPTLYLYAQRRFPFKHTPKYFPPCSPHAPCLTYTCITTVKHLYIYSCTLSKAHTQTQVNARTPQIHTEKLRCGIQNQCYWLESLSTASDVTSACSVSCSSPTPFLLPSLFHQLNPSFDTSEGVPHMHVTSPLLHQCFLPGFLLRARISVWKLCTL